MSKNRRKQEPATAPNDASAQADETVTQGDSDDVELDVGAELQAAPVVVEPSGPVLCAVLSNLHHDGGEYRPGNMVKLQPHQADELSKLGIVTRALPRIPPLVLLPTRRPSPSGRP